jgi:N utilization substance protein A
MDIQVKQLVLAIKTIAEEKNLPNEVVHDIIEQAIAAAWRKDFGDKDQEVTASINTTNGDVTIFIHRRVVEEVENEESELTLEEAKKIKPDAEIGDDLTETDKPTTFGRVAAQTAKQVILQKLREAEREIVLEEYSDKIGMVLTGNVQRVESRLVRVDLGKAQGILPASEQIPGEYYQAGARIKVFLKDVERSTRGPQLILSRANEEFITDLFKSEVPEMETGAVEIKAISREAGVRTKIAVASSIPGVDPVGTFVGGHGTRVQAVMSEIGDSEKIDIVTFDEDLKKFIANALSPTNVASVDIDEQNHKVLVKVNEDQLSVAIGKGGQNVRLASKLVGYDIDIESTGNTSEGAEAPAAQPKPQSEASNKPRRKSKRDSMEDSLLSALESADDDEQPDEDSSSEEDTSEVNDTENSKEAEPDTATDEEK